MQLTYVTLLMTTLLAWSPMATANALNCADKQKEIEQQITYAKLHSQDARIAALETALANNKANCTDDKLLRSQQETVKEKQAKVTKAEKKLNEAKASGKASKIKERTRELEEAQKTLAAERALLPTK
jgi:hypothetical protein